MARDLPPARRRHSPAERRLFLRRRLLVAAVPLTLVAIIALLLSRGSGGHRVATARTLPTTGKPAGSRQLQVSLAPWQLGKPLSRAVALPVDGRLGVFGGLGSGNVTTAAITAVNPSSGQAERIGSLARPVHDAAGAGLGSRYFVFGGGSATVSSDVQEFSPTGGANSSVAGSLPSRRADLAVAQANGKILLVGGYDGSRWTADVLQTTDGLRFTTLAQLSRPVRYPAVTVLNDKLYVIGGELQGGRADSTAVQQIDLKTGTVTVAGELPTGLSHAVAANLNGTVYVFGGRSGGHAIDRVSALDPATGQLHMVAHLPVPTSDMTIATLGEKGYLLGGEGDGGQQVASVVIARVVNTVSSALAPRSRNKPPFDGKLLIADRGNNRLLLVDANRGTLWTFPSAAAPAPPQGFYFPDDAFFVKRGTAIITNEEDQHTIIELAYPSGQVLASYGHPNRPGRSSGYLNQPDDAYLLKDRRVTVADAKNCRILFLNPDFTYAWQVGTRGTCRHNLPNDVGYPNGDTPLADGNVLISEINGSWVDEITPTGTVVWSLKLPIAYPSDPQQVGPDRYLIADYSKPGGLYEFTREGQIVWSYSFSSGEAMLDHPSLSEVLPNGFIGVNDDYRHRVVIINPASKQIVWQYGQTDVAGTGPNQLNIPDGFDLLAPNGTSPTHPQTG